MSRNPGILAQLHIQTVFAEICNNRKYPKPYIVQNTSTNTEISVTRERLPNVPLHVPHQSSHNEMLALVTSSTAKDGITSLSLLGHEDQSFSIPRQRDPAVGAPHKDIHERQLTSSSVSPSLTLHDLPNKISPLKIPKRAEFVRRGECVHGLCKVGLAGEAS